MPNKMLFAKLFRTMLTVTHTGWIAFMKRRMKKGRSFILQPSEQDFLTRTLTDIGPLVPTSNSPTGRIILITNKPTLCKIAGRQGSEQSMCREKLAFIQKNSGAVAGIVPVLFMDRIM